MKRLLELSRRGFFGNFLGSLFASFFLRKANAQRVSKLIGGGDLARDFETKALVTAATIGADINYIRIAGYTTVGDGGGARYKRVRSQPGHALFLTSNGGTVFWEFADRILTPEMGGAKGDASFSAGTASSWTGTDNTVALQNVLDAHTYFNIADRVSFRKANAIYRTTGPLHCGYGVNTFKTTHIEGPGRAIDQGFEGPIILCDFSNAPGMTVNGGRDVLVVGLSFRGRLWDWMANNGMGNLPSASIDDTLGSNWIGRATGGPAVSANADTQYTPYAAVAIDPYMGPGPSPAYPNVTVPSYAGGPVAQYNRGFASSNTKFLNCDFEGFVCACAVQPCDSDANGDFTRFENCVFRYVKTGIAIGNTQSRQVHVEDCSFAFVFCLFDSVTYGRQNGKFGGPIIGCDAGNIISIFNIVSTSISGPFSVMNFYMEAGWKIGNIASGSAAENGITFYDCQFSFDGQTDQRGVPGMMLTGTNQAQNLRFIGGTFGNYASVCMLDFPWSDIIFEGTAFSPQTEAMRTASAYMCLASNATAQGVIFHNNGYGSTRSLQRMKFLLENADTLADGSAQIMGPRQVIGTNWPFCGCAYAEKLVEFSGIDGEGTWNPPRTSFIDKTQITSCRLVDKTLVFTMPGGTTMVHQFINGPLNGDVLLDSLSGSVFFVRSVTGTTVTAVLQNNYKASGGGHYSQPVAFSTSTGNFYCLNSRYYTPTFYTQGDFTSGSASISSVGNAVASNFWVTTDIKVGDYIWNDDTRNGLLTTGTGNGKLTAVTADTLTMAGNANLTSARQRLGIFIRTPPANG